MKVGVVRFPASNCDFDTIRYFAKFGHQAEFIWHKNTKMGNWDVLVIPGGFAFGDRIYKKATHSFVMDPGEMALRQPVMKLVKKWAKMGKPILGICNGFQILVKAKLLPGTLKQNISNNFYDDFLTCEFVGNSFFNDKRLLHKKVKIPIAHGFGRYMVSAKEYKELKKNGQIFFKYVGLNPNGSYKNIAGISNKQGTIFALMPHPERTPDGKYFMSALEAYVKKTKSS